MKIVKNNKKVFPICVVSNARLCNNNFSRHRHVPVTKKVLFKELWLNHTVLYIKYECKINNKLLYTSTFKYCNCVNSWYSTVTGAIWKTRYVSFPNVCDVFAGCQPASIYENMCWNHRLTGLYCWHWTYTPGVLTTCCYWKRFPMAHTVCETGAIGHWRHWSQACRWQNLGSK